jgi:nitroimidazol reductase NimA-like FMN-containing flavoprotein (pyridoxamine 5'-phosphate oxidase superfamily)
MSQGATMAEITDNGADNDRTDDERPDELEVLSYGECLAGLAQMEIGRLAVVFGHYPQIFPVNYRMDEHIVVFRTRPGTKLTAAHGKNVAFEVDYLDPVHHTGWSVSVQGMAEDVTDHRHDTVIERTEALGVEPWAGGPRSRLVRIIPAHITGRRITDPLHGWSTDGRGYL